MDRKQHWEQVYVTKAPDSVSWFQGHAEQSLRLIHNTGLGKNAAIVDVGGGASTLVDDLVAEGYTDLTVLDLSAAALAVAKQRLGSRALLFLFWSLSPLSGRPPSWHPRPRFHLPRMLRVAPCPTPAARALLRPSEAPCSAAGSGSRST